MSNYSIEMMEDEEMLSDKIDVIEYMIEVFEKAENSWIVGDTEADIMAGEILDIKSIGVLSGERNRIKMKHLGPDHIIEDITELPELLFFENG